MCASVTNFTDKERSKSPFENLRKKKKEREYIFSVDVLIHRRGNSVSPMEINSRPPVER
jgi:hypothetical protein